MKGRQEMLDLLFAVLGFVGIYAGLWYLFNKRDGGVG
jgi:hypothetical protein